MKRSKINYVTSLWRRYEVCIFALIVLGSAPALADQIGTGVSFSQASFTKPFSLQKHSRYGEIAIDSALLDGDGYINVERFEDGKPAGWVVKNLPVIAGSILSGVNTMFDLGTAGYQTLFSATVDFSPDPLEDDSSLKNQLPMAFALEQVESPLSAPIGEAVVAVPTPCHPLRLSCLRRRTLPPRSYIRFNCSWIRVSTSPPPIS